MVCCGGWRRHEIYVAIAAAVRVDIHVSTPRPQHGQVRRRQLRSTALLGLCAQVQEDLEEREGAPLHYRYNGTPKTVNTFNLKTVIQPKLVEPKVDTAKIAAATMPTNLSTNCERSP